MKLRKDAQLVMKAVATALVLIASAAVILWYGNTLNSWVLGGLIGGLAALLLSIPISLTIFSYLSRRHEQHLREEIEEEIALAQADIYEDGPADNEVYEVESYALHSVGEIWEEEASPSLPSAGRFPLLSAQQRLPIVPSEPLADRGLSPRHSTDALASRSESTTPQVKRRMTTRHLSYPGLPSFEPGSSRSQQQAAALRAARREAAQQYDNVDEIPTHLSRRKPSGRLQLPPSGQDGRMMQRTSRQLAPQNPKGLSQRSRHAIDSTLAQPVAEGSSTSSRKLDPQTAYLLKHYPQTGPMFHPFAQTDDLAQRPSLASQSSSSEAATDNLQKSLVRRAPYMYDDDPLRQKLAQQLHTPIVRRSSRRAQRDKFADEE